MSLAQKLFDKAFTHNPTRDPRSPAYRVGVMDALVSKQSGNKITNPNKPGTAKADAWIAGNREGRDLWRGHHEREVKS